MILTLWNLVQQKAGRRLSSKETVRRLSSSATRKRSAKIPAPLDIISDDITCSEQSKDEDEMLAGGHSSGEWLQDLDALNASLSPSSNTAADDASYFDSVPLEFPSNPAQTHIEQLAKLVIAIGRSVSTLSSSARTSSLSASFPPFSDICSSASSLITAMTQISQPDTRERDVDVSMQELDPNLNSITALDYVLHHSLMEKHSNQAALLNPGLLMMILACYQRVLKAFETICLLN